MALRYPTPDKTVLGAEQLAARWDDVSNQDDRARTIAQLHEWT